MVTKKKVPDVSKKDTAGKRKSTAARSKTTLEVLRQRELQYSTILATTIDGFWMADAQTQRLIEVNDAYCRMSGYTRAELLDMPVSQLEVIESPAEIAAHIQRLREQGADRFETLHRRKDGSIFPVDVSVQYLAEVDRTFAFLRDITERKQTENALRISEENYRLLVGNMNAGVFQTTLTGKFLQVNAAMVEMTGYDSAAELMSKPATVLYSNPADRERLVQALKNSSEIKNMEVQTHRKNGDMQWVSINAVLQRDQHGKPENILGVAYDITERKQSEIQLEAALDEAQLRQRETLALLKAAQAIPLAGTFHVAARQIFDLCKELIGAQSGYVALLSKDGSENEVLFLDAGGLPCTVDPELPMPIRGLRAIAYRTRDVAYDNDFMHSEWVKFMPMGHVTLENVLFAPLTVQDQVVGLIGIANKPGGFTPRDASLAKAFGDLAAVALKFARNQDELRESEERYQRITEAITDYVYTVEVADGRILKTIHHRGSEAVTGYQADEFARDPFLWLNMVLPEDRPAVEEQARKILAGEDTLPIEHRITRKDGTLRWVKNTFVAHHDEENKLVAYDGLISDITERKQAEEALREKEQHLRMIFETMSEGIALNEIVYDEQGEMVDYRILSVNKAFYSTADYRGREVIGGLATDLYGMSREFVKEFWKQHKEKNSTAYTEMLSPLDHRWFFVATSPFANNQFVTSFFDITPRKRVEEALRKSEAYLRGVFEHSPDMVYTLDVATRQRDFLSRDSFCGYSRSELEQPNSILYAVHPDDLPALQENWRQAGVSLSPSSMEFRLRDKDGKWEWIHQRVSPLSTNADGTPKEVMVLLSIITARKRAEEALHESEKSLREAQRLSHIGNWQWSVATDTVTWSEELYRINGRDLNLPAPSYAEMSACYTPESWQRLSAAVMNALQHGIAYELDLDIVRADGVIRRTFSRGEIDFDAAGKVIGLHGTVQDITERKQAEVLLRESEQRLRRYVENSPMAVIEWDMNFNVTRWSGESEKIFGWSAAETVGTPLMDLHMVFEEDIPLVQKTMQQLADGASKYVITSNRNYTRDRRVIYCVWYNTVLTDQQGRMVSAMSQVLDVTARVQAENQILQLNASLEQRVEERTRELRDAQEKLVRQEKLAVLGQLAGGVGHELRNPLGVISNAVYFLKMAQPDANAKVKEYLDLIEKHIHISDKIVSDLLDFTRVKFAERRPVAIAEAIHQTLERFPAPENVNVVINLRADLPQVYADPQHVIQVLGNLLLNACQAMPNGGDLTISASIQAGLVGVAVRDTGSGISAENMKNLFEPLFTTKPKGIGLGLAVSKKLIEANGGRIEAESEVGVGSTFIFYLPAYPERL